MHGDDPSIEGAILLSPPLHRATDADLERWGRFGKPVHVLVPEHDDYLQPEAARERFALIPQARVVAGPDMKHLWVGENAVRWVFSRILEIVNPDALPLATQTELEPEPAPDAEN